MNIKNTALILGFSMMFAGCLLFYLIFITAYLSPNQQFIIGVNWFGEANTELTIFTLLIPCIAYYTKHTLNHITNL